MTTEQLTPDLMPAPAVPRSAASPGGAMRAEPGSTGDESTRRRLGEFRALLVISLLMTESVSEDQILDLAASSAPGLGPWRIDGYGFTNGLWRPGLAGSAASPPVGLARQLAALGDLSGQLELPGRAWAWAYPLRGIDGPLGHLVASCDREPPAEQRFAIQVMAQQTGVAVSNARLHARECATAAELAAANVALAETVASLRRTMDVHDRLTRVAVSGEGQPGIARALHELTGMAVAIEDRYGNLSAWAGPGEPDPYPKESFAKREQVLRRLMRDGKPVREGERLVVLASPRSDVIGVLALIDPGHTADTADLVALEHGATVLSMELARLRGIADTELRLRRDLVHDLLSGTDDKSALVRAEALDYDLRRPHRVVIAEISGRARAYDSLLNAVRRTMRQMHLDGLFETWSGRARPTGNSCAGRWPPTSGGRCRSAWAGFAAVPPSCPGRCTRRASRCACRRRSCRAPARASTRSSVSSACWRPFQISTTWTGSSGNGSAACSTTTPAAKRNWCTRSPSTWSTAATTTPPPRSCQYTRAR
jgi:GGDEF-like domain